MSNNNKTPPGGFALVDDPDEPRHRIHYQTYGKGPNKIILLMGVGGTSGQWEPQLSFFASPERESIYQLVTVENRGIGLSETVAGRWTTSKLARDALRVLDHLHWKTDVHVVGLSMGGMIAQELVKQGEQGGLYSLGYFALSLPSGIRLLMQTTLARDPEHRLRSALRVLYPEEFLATHVPHPKDPELKISNFKLFRDVMIARSLREIERGIPVTLPVSTFFKQVFAVVTHRVTHQQMEDIHKKLNGRILVVTGDQDILVHMANSKRLADGLKAKYLELKGGGHGTFEQFADQINIEIERLILGGQAKI